MIVGPQPGFVFDANASYVIAGGLGGLGGGSRIWMTDRGAKTLILLSRFDPQYETAFAFRKELEDGGVSVAAPADDITNFSSLEHALATCMQTMPPIKGRFQAAVVLKVRSQLLLPKSKDRGIYTRFCRKAWISSFCSRLFAGLWAKRPWPTTPPGTPMSTLSHAIAFGSVRRPYPWISNHGRRRLAGGECGSHG